MSGCTGTCTGLRAKLRQARQEIKDFADYRALKRKQIERLEDKLGRIKNWCRAYPCTVDTYNGANMRHVVEGIQEIIDA